MGYFEPYPHSELGGLLLLYFKGFKKRFQMPLVGFRSFDTLHCAAMSVQVAAAPCAILPWAPDLGPFGGYAIPMAAGALKAGCNTGTFGEVLCIGELVWWCLCTLTAPLQGSKNPFSMAPLCQEGNRCSPSGCIVHPISSPWALSAKVNSKKKSPSGLLLAEYFDPRLPDHHGA